MDNRKIYRELHVPENEARKRMAFRLRVIEDTVEFERPLRIYYGIDSPLVYSSVPAYEAAPAAYHENQTAPYAAPEPAVSSPSVPATVSYQLTHEQQQLADTARMTIGEVHQQIEEETGNEYLA